MPEIELAAGITSDNLPPCYKELLSGLFKKQGLVRVEKKLEGGYSGGRVFWVRPYDKQNRAQLPQVVKLGPANIISQELEAYEYHIDGYLPLTIPIIDNCLSSDNHWGGLRYHLAGEGIFEFQDLLQYCQEQKNEADDIVKLIERQMLPAIRKLHIGYENDGAMKIQQTYDRVLPPVFTFKYISTLNAAESWSRQDIVELSPQAISPHCEKKKAVIHDFIVTEKDALNQSVTINLSLRKSTERPVKSFRIRIKSVGDHEKFVIGEKMPPIEAELVETRMENLEAEVHNALFPIFQFNAKEIRLDNETSLINPLSQFSYLLDEILDYPAIGTVHGDLNLHNVLICIENGLLNFIDVASARRDHVLTDHLRLEAEIVVKLLASLIAKNRSDMMLFYSFYMNLHNVCTAKNQRISTIEDWLNSDLEKSFRLLQTVRQDAERYFQDWNEYYMCLVLYLLGTLKFKNLNEKDYPLAKRTAVIAAATLMTLVEEQQLMDRKIPEELPPVPLGIFNKQDEIMQKMQPDKIAGVAIIPLSVGAKISFDVSSSQIGTHSLHITVEVEDRLLIEGWGKNVEPTPVRYSQFLEGWPNQNHDLRFRLIKPGEKFPYRINNQQRTESLNSSIILSAWWIAHTVKSKDKPPFTEEFMLLIKR